MPSSIVQGVVELVLQGIIEIGCYYLGRIVVPVISLGRWKCDTIAADVPKQKLRKGGFYHLRGQQIYLTAQATQFVGFISLVLAGAATFLIYILGE